MIVNALNLGETKLTSLFFVTTFTASLFASPESTAGASASENGGGGPGSGGPGAGSTAEPSLASDDSSSLGMEDMSITSDISKLSEEESCKESDRKYDEKLDAMIREGQKEQDTMAAEAAQADMKLPPEQRKSSDAAAAFAAAGANAGVAS